MIFFKKDSYFNLIIFKNYNINIFNKNIFNYNLILIFYNFNFSFQLLFSFKYKYSWIDTKNDFNKFYFNFSENHKFIEFFQNIFVQNDFNKFQRLNNFIKFKHKLGFFKKVNSIKNVYLNKNNMFKFNFLDNANKHALFNDNLSFKNFDFVEKKLFFYKNNRQILKFILKKNKKRDYFINKFIKKISKSSIINSFTFFEFSITNVLLNSNFFLNKNDVYYFIKNNFVYINNKVVSNINTLVKKNDLISVCYNKYYYFLYKNNLNNLNLNINKYNSFFKKTNTNNLKNDFNFVNKLISLKNDVPEYLEIDYVSMSLILLYTDYTTFNCFDFKLVNLFLRRLNNWKRII